MSGTLGAGLNYDDNWVGRYYVQETRFLGISFLPSIAYRVNDKLSLGASVNAMLGSYKNNVAINTIDPLFGDGQLKLQDSGVGGAVLSLLQV
jgi:long-chain fatty acid transport protein